MRSAACAVLALSLSTWALGAGKVESIAAPEQVPAALGKALQARGYRVSLGDGVACDLWMRARIPVTAGRDVDGALFGQIAEGTLLGVVSFPKPFVNYRGQLVPPGWYTLRYALLPTDGNHLGVAPSRDFVLLLRLADDPDPNAEFNAPRLEKLSRKASSSEHPSPMNLVQPETADYPSVSNDAEGHTVLAVKLNTADGGDLPLGIVVKGVGQQ
jgi:hypothetical protein